MSNKTFKLIVQDSDNCIELLRYINRNICDIMKMNVRIRVQKIDPKDIDEEELDYLRKKGITRLPTMVSPDGKLFIGCTQIRSLFEKNMNRRKIPMPINDDEILSKHYMSVLKNNKIDKTQLMMEDKEDDDFDSTLNQKMNAFNKARLNRPVAAAPAPEPEEDNIANDEPVEYMKQEDLDNNVHEMMLRTLQSNGE